MTCYDPIRHKHGCLCAANGLVPGYSVEFKDARPDLRTVAQKPTAPERPSALENYSKLMATEKAALYPWELATSDGRRPSKNDAHVSAEAQHTDDQKQHNDAGKLPMSKLPWGPLKKVMEVLVYGHKKYGSWGGWKGIPNGAERVFDSAMRHAVAYAGGEKTDPESGLPHLAHMATDVLFALWFEGFK